MTNEEIKTNLKKLFDCKEDFTVTMTGKKSNKVNGLYRPATHEIFLHNKNFATTNELMYTAVHEFTHHILTTEKNIKTAKAHSGIFWSNFYDLLDKAIDQGLYSRNRSSETAELIDAAKEIQKEIIEAQKKLGEIISKLYDSCAKNNERVEDVIEHDLQITRRKAAELTKNSRTNTEYNDEMAKVILSAKNDQVKAAAQKAADDGKTVEQVKAIAKQKKPKQLIDGLDRPEQLLKEKKRLEKTIEQLNDRLIQVEEILATL